MINIEDDCVGCPDGVPCLGSSCPNRNVKHYYCDECGHEDDLYWWDDEQLCMDCIEEREEKTGVKLKDFIKVE